MLCAQGLPSAGTTLTGQYYEAIRDELAKLGLHLSTATIRKYRPQATGHRSQSWWTFLRNHTGAIAAMDFFVVPTVTFRLLYVLVVIRHERRKIFHFIITEAPTATWTAQQVINAFPYDTAPEYLLRDRDSICGSLFGALDRGDGYPLVLLSSKFPSAVVSGMPRSIELKPLFRCGPPRLLGRSLCSLRRTFLPPTA